jgi:hypothetical protein
MLDKTAGLEPPENASALNNLAALYPRRLAAISTERLSLQKILSAEFPDCAALSNPVPMTVKQMQSL